MKIMINFNFVYIFYKFSREELNIYYEMLIIITKILF